MQRRIGIFNQGMQDKQEIVAQLLSLSFLIFFSLHLALSHWGKHKQKKIIKCGELFAHSYSCGVAQQCDWLTTLPYVLYILLLPFVSHCSFCFQTLPFTFLSLSHYYTVYTGIYAKYKPLCFLPRTTFFVWSRYKFIPLTFSLFLFLPSVSLHFQSTIVLDSASILTHPGSKTPSKITLASSF